MATTDSNPRTIEIQLTKGYVAIVDEQDADLALLKWQFSHGYAVRSLTRTVNGRKRIIMHRLILERVLGTSLVDTIHVDHINRNKLDNRRSNLRCASQAQNNRNMGVFHTNTSGYKGVSYFKRLNSWRARINVDGKQIDLGTYKQAIEAAAVYNHYAVLYYGEFGFLNEVENWRDIAHHTLLERPVLSSKNTSGYKGVYKHTDTQWQARVRADGKEIYLGLFSSPEKANEARQAFLEAK